MMECRAPRCATAGRWASGRWRDPPAGISKGRPLGALCKIEIGTVQNRLNICGYYEGAVRNPSRNIRASGSKTIAVARRAARSARCRHYCRCRGVLVAYRTRVAIARADTCRRQAAEPRMYAQPMPRKIRSRSAPRETMKARSDPKNDRDLLRHLATSFT
jgi:hypothetical protein